MIEEANNTIGERAVRLVYDRFGEIGNLSLEDGYICFEVYLGDYEDAPQKMLGINTTMELVEKFEDPFFTVIYRIS